MATPVKVVNLNESVQVLANLLLDTNHGGFPVVSTGFGFKKTFLGIITR
jgi:CBS domain-containing protein